MNDAALICRNQRRRRDTRRAPLLGIDYVEVDLGTDRATVQVFFLGEAPAAIVAANVRIRGGQRVREFRIEDLRVHRSDDATLDESLEFTVLPAGDASVYTLSLVNLDANGRATDEPMDGFDPRYASVDFSFRAGCPTDFDCAARPVCPPPQRNVPEINYLAKDYDSFRQLLLDRLAVTLPQWRETHVPDIGVALVEVLAYAADYLSDYQDAVATEAYLGTARQRISVRRHARLVDYFMHEGCNARAWVTIATDTDAVLDAREFYFAAGLPQPDVRVLQPDEYAQLPPGPYEIYGPLVADPTAPIRLYATHSEIRLYAWGDCACCLPSGATAATLVDTWVASNEPPPSEQTPSGQTPSGQTPSGQTPSGQTPGESAKALVRVADTAPPAPVAGEPPGMKRGLNLSVGDVLIFEEVIGPKTGNSADADPAHRQAVRLTKVTRAIDPLYHPYGQSYGQPIVEVEWCSEDALTFPLCVSAVMPAPDCTCRENISVARGNVLLVDHGAAVDETLDSVPEASRVEICATDCDPPDTITTPATFRPIVRQRPLTFGQPLPLCGCASTTIRQDPRLALPQLHLTVTPPSADGAPATVWTPQRDLLASGATDRHFVVEMDDDRNAHLRFGDGDLGARPEAGTVFEASYRIGSGPDGNVGAEAIRCLVFRQTTSGIGKLEPRNPLAASGGVDPEPVDEVKLVAPYAFRNVLERAITADDYATLAADDPRRLSRRPMLLAPAAAVPALPPHTRPDDPRAAIEEEPGERGIGDICSIPFRRLQGARATLRWNGSWYEALVAVDPLGGEGADDELVDEIEGYLEPYRRIGHDLDVRSADYVPIDLMLSICVKPAFQRGHVEAALLDVFGNGVLPDGRLGFFHPDNLSFGQDLHVSSIVAAAQAVAGVLEAHVVQLERFDPSEPMPDVDEELPPGGVLALGPFEIARLDNDPSRPENGRLRVVMRGGR